MYTTHKTVAKMPVFHREKRTVLAVMPAVLNVVKSVAMVENIKIYEATELLLKLGMELYSYRVLKGVPIRALKEAVGDYAASQPKND